MATSKYESRKVVSNCNKKLAKSFQKNQGFFLSFGNIFFQKHSPGQAISLDIKRFLKKILL
jgi:hypothetical protein